MATTRLLSDAEVEKIPAVKAVFDDIRATRKSDFVNNFWRGLANDPPALKRIWEQLKVVMVADSVSVATAMVTTLVLKTLVQRFMYIS